MGVAWQPVRMSILRLLALAGALLLAIAAPAAAKPKHHKHHKPKDVKVQLLALNDFHGNLQTTTTGGIRLDPPPVQPAPPAPRCRRPGPPAARAILGSYVRELERGNRNSLLVSAGDLIGASPLAVGALPRRAHDRGHEPARARPQRGRQPRVRRGRRRAQAHAARRLPPGRRLRGRHRFQGRGLQVPRRQRDPQGQRQDAVPALRDPPLPGQEDRLHRHDARRDAEHRLAVRHRQPRASSTRRRPRTATRASSGAATASRRSSCCSTRAASQTRCHAHREPGTSYTGCIGLSGPIVDIVSNTTDDVDLFVTGHTHQAVQLRDRRPPGHELELGRPAAHRHRPHARPQRRRQGRAGATTSRCTQRAARRISGVDELSSSTRSGRGRSGETRGRPGREGHHADDRRRTTVARERARQPDRRRPARRHRRRRPRRRRRRADEPGRRARRPGLSRAAAARRRTASSPTRRRSPSSRSTTS